MELTGPVLVFLAQMMCCALIRHKWMKYLPTLLCAAMISVTVLGANAGQVEPQRLIDQTWMTLAGGAAAGLYHIILFARNRSRGRK